MSMVQSAGLKKPNRRNRRDLAFTSSYPFQSALKEGALLKGTSVIVVLEALTSDI